MHFYPVLLKGNMMPHLTVWRYGYRVFGKIEKRIALVGKRPLI